jgi:hypothetical protein
MRNKHSSYMGNVRSSIKAMDARWKLAKACDTKTTALRLWMLMGSKEMPKIMGIKCRKLL